MFRLEKLELNGFKSFSSRTEFVFGAGITAVVGPNGCGKSNIADSINWVIGGQSSRALRAEHMGDVIFNGSDARRPMGMAEVSLHLVAANGADHAGPPVELEVADARAGDVPATIDGGDGLPEAESAAPETAPLVEGGNGHAGGNGNGSHAEPADAAGEAPRRTWLDRQKVVITRRLFRSGESEYLLDGQKCRLRDIQDFLAEVHIGTGLYSVIEQGRVDSVLLSRPRDRRVLIEEAAGIALYKVRKRQAQSKLEATEANLLRIHDIVSELEKQIGSLKRQAARARRYARISAEIEKGERILFHHESVRLDGEAAQLAARRVDVEDHGARAAATVGKAEALVAEGREAVAEEAARHQAAREGLHALDRALDQIKAGIDRFREQETEATTHLARGAAEAASLAERLATAADRDISLARDLDGAAAEWSRAEASVRDHEASARLEAAALQAAEAWLASAREEAVAGAGALSECRNEIRRLDESGSRWRAEESRLERLVAEIGDEGRGLVERGREHETGRAAFGASLLDLRAIIEEGTRALRAAESRREALLLEREERRGRLRAIEERIVSLAGMEEAGGEELETLQAGSPARFLKDMLSPPEGYDRAVDAALRGLLRGRVIDSIDEATALMASLKDRGMGRAVLIPAESRTRAGEGQALPPRASGSLGTLAELLDAGSLGIPGLAVILDRVAVAADVVSALALREAMPGRDVVTLSGDFLSRDGWMEGGAEIPEEAGVMTLRRLMHRLGADAESTGARVAMLDGEIEASERMVADLRSRAADLRRREAILEKQGETLRVEEEVLRSENARLELRREAHAADLTRVREDLAAGETARTSVAALLAETLNRHDGLLREAESLAGSVDAARAGLVVRNAALAAQRSAASASRERRASLEAESRHHAAAIADLGARIEREREDRTRWDVRLSEARARLAEDTAVLADRMADRVLADGLVASAEAALMEKRGALPALEEGVRRAREGHDEAREALHAVALDEERLIGDRRGLEARVLERGLPSLAAAVQDLTPEERALDPETVKSEIASQRERRDAMGAVNLMAVEQFRELEDRHTFITTQRRDLEDSIRSLKETIARINRQSRERFLDAFEKIRTGFADIFKILFGGGRADLRLVTDGDEDGDLLEAGLEISAQPPGKRLQSLSLLSGGEKALTAIALLFAIFRYSPSPFCLLDEVDAPLDEANVMRFNALLERMSSETQFLMITHNRRSMEAAAMLYGITMEEPGVSRAVSVVMASEADRKEAVRTLPALLASRHRGHAGRPRPIAPAAGGNGA